MTVTELSATMPISEVYEWAAWFALEHKYQDMANRMAEAKAKSARQRAGRRR